MSDKFHSQRLHINVGFEDGRPEWVDSEAEEIHQGHDAWPDGTSADTHRVWHHADTGAVWRHMRPEIRRLQALAYHEQVNPDSMTPDQRRELALLRSSSAHSDAGGARNAKKIPAKEVLAIREARRNGMSVAVLAKRYDLTRSYIYDLCSGRARAEVKDPKPWRPED